MYTVVPCMYMMGPIESPERNCRGLAGSLSDTEEKKGRKGGIKGRFKHLISAALVAMAQKQRLRDLAK